MNGGERPTEADQPAVTPVVEDAHAIAEQLLARAAVDYAAVPRGSGTVLALPAND
ncbi:hypothetical protein ABZ312_23645 [Streptomyces sp. NPDC006207]